MRDKKRTPTPTARRRPTQQRPRRAALRLQFKDVRATFGTGLEAGLVGVSLTLPIPVLLWVFDVESMVCVIPMLGNLIFWPAVGLLAAHWLKAKGSMHPTDQLASGLLGGLMTGLASGLACSTLGVLRVQTTANNIFQNLLSGMTIDQLMLACWFLFGFPLVLAGMLCAGLASILTARHLEPFVPDVPIPAARIRSALGGPAEFPKSGGTVLKPLLEAMPPHLQPAVAALEAGDTRRASGLLASALHKRPNDVQAWLWMAVSMEDAEHKQECLQRALSLDPSNSMARQMQEEIQHLPSSVPSPVQPLTEGRLQRLWNSLLAWIPTTVNPTLLVGLTALEVLLLCVGVYLKLS